MTSYYITIAYKDRTLTLHAPTSWTVSRLKELILMYHPESPSIRSQVLVYNSITLRNSDLLKDLFHSDQRPELILQTELIEEIPEHMSGYRSELFKLREEEYIKKYDLAKQLLLDTHQKVQESSILPVNSVISTLPIAHPEFQKRVRSLAMATKPAVIRLRKIPYSVYLNLSDIIRSIIVMAITQQFLGRSLPLIYYLFVVVCYLLSVRNKIDQHLQRELRRLPREYLMKTLPDRFKSEVDQEAKISVIAIGYETVRAFVLSFLPWFDPLDYANTRGVLYRRNVNVAN